VSNDYGQEPLCGQPDYRKTPDEAIRIDFEWAVKLDGETVSSVSYELPDGLTNEAESGTGATRSVRVSGGSTGSIYRVIGKVTTSGTQDFEWVKRVLVEEG
jgi:hypothetical protein